MGLCSEGRRYGQPWGSPPSLGPRTSPPSHVPPPQRKGIRRRFGSSAVLCSPASLPGAERGANTGHQSPTPRLRGQVLMVRLSRGSREKEIGNQELFLPLQGGTSTPEAAACGLVALGDVQKETGRADGEMEMPASQAGRMLGGGAPRKMRTGKICKATEKGPLHPKSDCIQRMLEKPMGLGGGWTGVWLTWWM